MTARATGYRVEDLSQRTPFTRVYANPDGTWTSEVASTPESVQDDQGNWHEIDPTLAPDGDRLAPQFAMSDVSLSAGGDRVFATMSESGRDLEWRWPTVLPAPTVDGAVATYAGAAAGGAGDLVVTATDGGFTYDVVLHEQPAGSLEMTVPVVTDGAVLQKSDDGDLAVTTKAGDLVATVQEPVMYDATTNEDGDHTNVADVGTEVGKTPAGTPTLTLLPDQDFLWDPSTVYPVTVDPTVNGRSWADAPLYSTDAWIQYPDFPNGQVDSQELRVGSKDAGTHKARSFMHFGGTSNLWGGGKVIDSADLVMRNFDSGSCASGVVRASMIIEAWGANVSWPGPVINGAYDADYSPAYGASSSCPTADATWNVTSIVRQWAAGTPNNGIRLNAPNATSSTTWRRYRSANYTSSTTVRPHLNVTWHTLPGTPVTPTMSPANPYTSAGVTTLYTSVKKPTFTSTVTDQDGGDGSITFRVYPARSTQWYTACTAYYTTAGDPASCTSTDPLPDGGYTVKGKAGDYWNYSSGDGSLDSATGWSPALEFTVDSTPPTASITASEFTDGQWRSDRPTTNVFRFTGPTDTKSYTYSLDGGTPQSAATDLNGIAEVGWLPSEGGHTVSATPIDRAGNVGAPSIFQFGIGAPGLTTPDASAQSAGMLPTAATAPPGSTSASVEWRRSGASSWNSATHVTRSGAPWSGTVTNSLSATTTGPLVWSATDETMPDTLDKLAAPASVDLRICFTYPNAPRACTSARSIDLIAPVRGGDFPSVGCSWAITDRGDTVQLARPDGISVLAQTSGGDDSPVFYGEVDGRPVTVTLWRGTPAAEGDAQAVQMQGEWDSLSQQSMDGSVDTADGVDQPAQAAAEFTGGTRDGAELGTVGYRIESDYGTEYGVESDPADAARHRIDCAAPVQAPTTGSSTTQSLSAGGGDDSVGTVVIPTSSGTFSIAPPTDNKTSTGGTSSAQQIAPGGADGQSDISAFKYRTFIPEAQVDSGDDIPGGGCGIFRGDNRGFSRDWEAPSRSAVTVYFDWTGNKVSTNVKIGTTHKLRADGSVEKSKTASADGVKFSNGYVEGHRHGHIRINHAVGNPLCKILGVNVAGPIFYSIVVDAWSNGAVSILGTKGKVPNHEAYWFPRSSDAQGKTIMQKKHGSYACLTLPSLAGCGPVTLKEEIS